MAARSPASVAAVRYARQAKLETVVRISTKEVKPAVVDEEAAAAAANATAVAEAAAGGHGKHSGVAGDAASGAEAAVQALVAAVSPVRIQQPVMVEPDVDRIIDSHDNEFVLSKPRCGCGVKQAPLYGRQPGGGGGAGVSSARAGRGARVC